jgi:hypothetical protein
LVNPELWLLPISEMKKIFRNSMFKLNTVGHLGRIVDNVINRLM